MGVAEKPHQRGSLRAGAMMAKATKTDPIVAEMDKFAKELMDEARSVNVKVEGDAAADDRQPVTLQTRLDVFRQLAQWVGIKNRLNEADPDGGSLDDLKRRVRAKSPPYRGTARIPGPGGNQFASSAVKNARRYPDGDGGSALDAIKRQLPPTDAGDDDGAGDGAER